MGRFAGREADNPRRRCRRCAAPFAGTRRATLLECVRWSGHTHGLEAMIAAPRDDLDESVTDEQERVASS